MNYGRLTPKSQSEPEPEPEPELSETVTKSKSKLKLLLTVVGITLIVASAVSVTLAVTLRPKSSGAGSSSIRPQPTKAISRVCSRTLYQNLCVNSFLDFPGSLSASDKDLVHISVNMTLRHVGHALYTSTDFNNLEMSTRVRSAYNDCLELLDESMDQLQQSLTSVSGERVGSPDDVMTWLSASLTNQETCTEGLSEAEEGQVKYLMHEKMQNLSELVSNSLAIYSSAKDEEDFNGVPIQNRRRLMREYSGELPRGFPVWMKRKERKLMEMPVAAIQADIVVSKDGNGTCKTIKEAIKKAPEKSSRRFIIYVKAGR